MKSAVIPLFDIIIIEIEEPIILWDEFHYSLSVEIHVLFFCFDINSVLFPCHHFEPYSFQDVPIALEKCNNY
jgi:hypothetical protein